MIVKAEECPHLRRPLEDEEWRDHFDAIRKTIANADEAVFKRLADHIRRLIDELNPLMTTYCSVTCPTCNDRCCEGLKVFFNRTDLIYLAASGEKVVLGQTRTREGERCRYLGEAGCLLSRRVRPYVCVWFLCEPQVALLGLESARRQRAVTKTLLEIREARLILESLHELCAV
jgi:hypothetical protein